MITENNLKFQLSHHTGSDIFHGPMTKPFKYTEGAKHYFELAQCWWLHDILATEFRMAIIRTKQVDTFYFTITVKEMKAVLVLNDYNEKEIFSKNINYTSHPDGEYKLEIGNHGKGLMICCLPSEN